MHVALDAIVLSSASAWGDLKSHPESIIGIDGLQGIVTMHPQSFCLQVVDYRNTRQERAGEHGLRYVCANVDVIRAMSLHV
jgi:hypothetical protein